MIQLTLNLSGMSAASQSALVRYRGGALAELMTDAVEGGHATLGLYRPESAAGDEGVERFLDELGTLSQVVSDARGEDSEFVIDLASADAQELQWMRERGGALLKEVFRDGAMFGLGLRVTGAAAECIGLMTGSGAQTQSQMH
jgi:hypothetical protein